jgi:hypothetical protein
MTRKLRRLPMTGGNMQLIRINDLLHQPIAEPMDSPIHLKVQTAQRGNHFLREGVSR